MSVKLGRPRDAALDQAIAAATERLLVEHGYAAVTIDRVAREAGTTRTAVYRRVSSRVALVTAAMIDRYGTDPAPDTGDLRGDLIELQGRQRTFFEDPAVSAALTGVLGDIRDNPELGAAFHERFMAPRRRSTAGILQRAADRGEIEHVRDTGLVSDLLTGPLLLRTVLPLIGPIDDALIAATVESVLSVCRS